MSQEFKTKFEKMRENLLTATEEKAEGNASEDKYPASSYARNIIFRWPDGRMKFLNYSYLVSCEYLPKDSTITIAFTSDIVDLKGEQLEDLFLELAVNRPKLIQCTDKRYNDISEVGQSLINEIIITKTTN